MLPFKCVLLIFYSIQYSTNSLNAWTPNTYILFFCTSLVCLCFRSWKVTACRNISLSRIVENNKTSDKKPDDKPEAKKHGKPVYITLLGTDGVPTTSNLDSAIKLSRRRNLRLIKVSDYDSIRQTPVYKLLTGSEVLKEDLESKKKGKDNSLKSEKIVSISDNISLHDLHSKLKQVFKWIEKKHGVRVTINGSINNNKSEIIFKEIEEKVKPIGRILQKRTSGNDLKFQLIPLKETSNSVQ